MKGRLILVFSLTAAFAGTAAEFTNSCQPIQLVEVSITEENCNDPLRDTDKNHNPNCFVRFKGKGGIVRADFLSPKTSKQLGLGLSWPCHGFRWNEDQGDLAGKWPKNCTLTLESSEFGELCECSVKESGLTCEIPDFRIP